jgi:hypothetical protein
MNNRFIWLGILIVLAVTLVSVANCRKPPDPWEPKTGSGAEQLPR